MGKCEEGEEEEEKFHFIRVRFYSPRLKKSEVRILGLGVIRLRRFPRLKPRVIYRFCSPSVLPRLKPRVI